MKISRRILGALGGGALLAATVAAPAMAGTSSDHYPETPNNSAKLPVVNTYHGSDHIKANALNPHPVCNAWEDRRTSVNKVTDAFSPVGTISTTNQTTKDIPLTQTLSKTQSIKISVNGSQTEKTDVNLGGTGSADKGSVNAGIAYSLAKTIGGDASYELSWNVGQEIGPYNVPAGKTGEATYGFRTIHMTGTQQYCKLDGTWSNPTAWTAFVPVKNEVRVKLYGDASESADK